jgi:hypothetical protein
MTIKRKLMKSIFISLSTFFAAALFSNCVQAQITLDHAYTSSTRDEIFMVSLENSGPKYVLKCTDSGSRYLKFYNLNHSLWKTINCNSFKTTVQPVNGQTQFIFGSYYISESLFDCDTNIEFLYVSFAAAPWQAFVGVYNEHGTLVFGADSMSTDMSSVGVRGDYQNRTIYNTPTGTKMTLYKNQYVTSPTAGWIRVPMVYNLPCTLTTGVGGIPRHTVSGEMSVTPNPYTNQSKVSYKLPEDVREADLIITDLQGKEIKRYRVDRTFDSLLIGPDDLPSGTYMYSLSVGGRVLNAKKVIKIN